MITRYNVNMHLSLFFSFRLQRKKSGMNHRSENIIMSTVIFWALGLTSSRKLDETSHANEIEKIILDLKLNLIPLSISVITISSAHSMLTAKFRSCKQHNLPPIGRLKTCSIINENYCRFPHGWRKGRKIQLKEMKNENRNMLLIVIS